MRIGLVSDTHGRFDPALPLLFARCDLILHAGDVGGREILFQLQGIAPVLAVRGNCDTGALADGLLQERVVNLQGLRALLIHDIGKPEKPFGAFRDALRRERPDLVVHGHSHVPAAVLLEGVLFVNPGSAGPRRFSLPRTAAVVTVEGRRVRVELSDLEDRELGLLRPASVFDLPPAR